MSEKEESLKQKWVDDTPRVSILKRLRDTKIVNSVWGVITNTPIEIAVGAIAFGAWIGPTAYDWQAQKRGQIPLAFSEIEETKAAFAKKGEPVPPLTMFYSVTNDVAMKVFEANNKAFVNGYGDEAFAVELRKKVDPAHKDHALISEYAADYRGYARDAFASLAKPMAAANKVDMARHTAASVWNESHTDHYRTRTYTVTVGTGENRRTETRTERVYDYTIHDYDYYPAQGAELSRQLADLANTYPHLNLTETLRAAQKTNAANQDAIRESMKALSEKSEPTAADYLELANRWATGSTFTKYYPDVRASYGDVVQLSREWQTAHRRARSDRYRTSSRFDSGPREFQMIENGTERMEEMSSAMQKIADGIQLGAERVPALNDKIKTYVGVVLEGKPGNAKELRSEIMSDARKIYDANFPGGFDVHPFKWGWVALYTLLGTLAGAGIGTGIDRSIFHFTRRRVPEKESVKTMPVW
ncbi:MAG: hypothetical protein AB7H77_12580, partial [Bdellovibrionales bacterium]